MGLRTAHPGREALRATGSAAVSAEYARRVHPAFGAAGTPIILVDGAITYELPCHITVEQLKKARKAQGLSLRDVSERTGLHREAIARAERSDVDPRASTVARIAKAIGVPVCLLFDEDSRHERHHTKRRRPT